MTLAGFPDMTHDSAAMPLSPPAGAAWPYMAMTPALMKSQIIISKAPMRNIGRRPHLSIQINAGMVVMTLMTYWMDEETSMLFPVKPAMEKTYVI